MGNEQKNGVSNNKATSLTSQSQIEGSDTVLSKSGSESKLGLENVCDVRTDMEEDTCSGIAAKGYWDDTSETARYMLASMMPDRIFPKRPRSFPNFISNLCLVKCLRFEVNPLDSNEDAVLGMISNLSTSYNVVAISLALTIMGGDSLYADFVGADTKSVCTSALIAGMILGQIVGGSLGDWLGRHKAIAFVMAIQTIGSMGSATMTHQSLEQFIFLDIFRQLAAWRFLLGFGCGGIYPLAAVISAESASNGSGNDRAKLVALTFSMQGVGFLAVPLTACMLLFVLGERSDFTWRLLLGLGCVPGMYLGFVRWSKFRNDSAEETNPQESLLDNSDNPLSLPSLNQTSNTADISSTNISILQHVKAEDSLLKKLMGTAFIWFHFDVLFYGNTLFAPVVLKSALGEAETVFDTAADTLLIALLSLPGYFVSIFAVGKLSPKFIQAQGFLFMSILYLIIGFTFDDLSQTKDLLLFIYASTFFFSNFGPNTTTFMLPSMIFSPGCRSTMNGICAASGKAGALFGSIIFIPVSDAIGNATVMLICAGVSLFSLAITLWVIPSEVGTETYCVGDDEQLEEVQED